MFATYATSLSSFASARKANPKEEQSGKRETKLKVSIDAWESPPRGVDSEEAGRSSHGSFAIFFERIDWDRGHDFIDASMNRSAL